MTSQAPEEPKRQAKVRPKFATEADVCGVPLPHSVVRLARLPPNVDGTTTDAPPMLYAQRPAKSWVNGRDTTAGIIKAVKKLMAVYSIVASRLLQASGKSRQDAIIVIEKVAAQSFSQLEKTGRRELSTLTGFDSDDELVAWATHQSSLFRIPALGDGKRASPLQASIDVISLLQVTSARTTRILKAIHATQLAADEKVGSAVAEALKHSPQFEALDCYRVALFADISPTPIWRTHARYAHVFEIARFIGHIDRGAKASLVPGPHSQTLEQALAGTYSGEDAALAAMYKNIRLSVEVHFGIARFRDMLRHTQENEGVLVVDRRSRRLRCRTDVDRRMRVLGADRGVSTLEIRTLLPHLVVGELLGGQSGLLLFADNKEAD